MLSGVTADIISQLLGVLSEHGQPLRYNSVHACGIDKTSEGIQRWQEMGATLGYSWSGQTGPNAWACYGAEGTKGKKLCTELWAWH